MWSRLGIRGSHACVTISLPVPERYMMSYLQLTEWIEGQTCMHECPRLCTRAAGCTYVFVLGLLWLRLQFFCCMYFLSPMAAGCQLGHIFKGIDVLQSKKQKKLQPNDTRILDIAQGRSKKLSAARNTRREGGFGAGQPYQEKKSGIPSMFLYLPCTRMACTGSGITGHIAILLLLFLATSTVRSPQQEGL